MNIPEEAVEAAAEAIYELERGESGCRPFAEMPVQYIEEWREQAKVSLEAAAPHMLALVWQEAYGQGVSDERTSAACGTDCGPNRNDPYRSRG